MLPDRVLHVSETFIFRGGTKGMEQGAAPEADVVV
jgi:hypothetical protein